jgi:Protein of unknown function (DUF3738)
LRPVSAFLRKQIWKIISAVVRLPYPAVPTEIHVFFIAVSLVFVLPVDAQRATGSGTDLAARELTYEVVSIRPSNIEGMSISSSGDRFVARGTTLWGLLFNAYKLRPNDDVPGLPGWAKSEVFDVEAGMDADTYAELQKMPVQERSERRAIMLQALLADRFKLKMHYETRERPIYAGDCKQRIEVEGVAVRHAPGRHFLGKRADCGSRRANGKLRILPV